MKKIVHQTLIAMCISLSTTTFAVAPVVDESENFALFDEQLAAAEQPEAFDMAQEDNYLAIDEANDNIAIAREASPTDASADTTTLFTKMQNLQQELSELRGQLEVQTHALQTLKQQQLDFYKDLDARVQSTQNTTPAPAEVKNTHASLDSLPQSTAPRGNPADEQISYLAAYDLVKNKKFEQAIMAMKHFIQQYPRGGYTANAHYWLGELYMTQRAFPDAIEQFQTVLSTFPSSSKSSASSLKLGYALEASGEKDAARERLKMVIRDYPDTHAAELAASKLETLHS